MDGSHSSPRGNMEIGHYERWDEPFTCSGTTRAFLRAPRPSHLMGSGFPEGNTPAYPQWALLAPPSAAMRLLGAAPPPTWATEEDATCFILAITTYHVSGTEINIPRPGQKPGVSLAYIHSSSLPYLGDCKTHQQTQAPLPQPSLRQQHRCLHELAMTYTARELQDWALNCLKTHYSPTVT